MSFLAPLFLIGAAAIAAPVIFHLIRRTSREKVPFSSLMFLQPTPPRVTKKSRLENILLLILRCTVLALLALAFARPFLRKPLNAAAASGTVTRTVVLVDASASMRRDGLFEEAVAKAVEQVRAAGPSDQFAVYLFDRNARALVSFAEWNRTSLNERKTLAEQRLRAAQPTWNSTQLGNALIAAHETLEAEREFATAARRVVLISDLQEGARLEGLQGFPWPRQTTVTVLPVKARRPTNAGLQLLTSSASAQSTESVRVRVVNAIESGREQFELRWNGSPTNAVAAYVPPGQARTFDLARHAGFDALQLAGDEAPFDNSLFVVTPPRERIEVAFIGNDAEYDPQQLLFYLRRAFPETARQEVKINTLKLDGDFAPALRQANLIVLGSALTGEAQRTLATALTNGATILAALRSPAEAQAIAALAGQPISAEEGPTSGYAMLTEIAFSHPLFAPFADPRFSDFTKIHFWKHRKVSFGSTNVHVLARFDTGTPAVAQINVGKGTLFLLASSWQPSDSQLALSSKFVPLLYSLLEIGGSLKAQSLAFNVGDPVDLSGLRATNAVVIQKPDGTTASVAPGVKTFGETDLPGVYTVAATEPAYRFAVNVAPEESRTAPLAVEQLQQLGVPLKVPALAATPEQAAKKEAQLKSAELENSQKLWRWLIAATLVIIIVETWIAARLSRRAAVQPEGAS
jgi:hypothetical protein